MEPVDQEKLRLAELHQILEAVVEFLYEEEMEILVEVAQGIAYGQSAIGPFDLDNDPRDFQAEYDQEQRDELVYRAAEVVRERRRRNRGNLRNR